MVGRFMRLSDRYIGRQVLAGTLFAVALLSGMMVMGTLFKEIRKLLVDFGAPVSVIGEFVVGVIPFSLIYTLPWAFLSAVLLVFGRLSSDQELTAFRVAGIGLPRLAAPVFVLGAALSLLCLWLNVDAAPRSRAHVKGILIRAFFKDPRSMLSAAAERDGLEQLESSLKSTRAYIEKSDNDGKMQGLHLFSIRDRDDPGSRDIYVHAMRAETIIDDRAQEFRLHLYDAFFETADDKGRPQPVIAQEAVPVVVPYSFVQRDRLRASTKTNREIREILAGGDLRLKPEDRIGKFVSEIHHRYASSFACLAFAFIGVPLGIKARRRDTSTGLVLSLLIGAAYFGSSMIGGKTEAAVIAAAWAPNVLCVLLGICLFRRARFR